MIVPKRSVRGRRPNVRKIVVGHSGGVTSAWAVGWALREFPREWLESEEEKCAHNCDPEEDDDVYQEPLS